MKISTKIAVGLGLMSFASLALAIPVIIGAVVGALAGAAAVATGIVVATMVTAVVVGAVVGAATGYFMMNAYKIPDGIPSVDVASSYASGLTVTQQGADNNIPVIYGRRRVGGSLVYLGSRGDSNKYLYQVIVLAEGRCAGPERIYIDDELMWIGEAPVHASQFTANTGGATKRKYLTFQYFDGRDDQTTSSIMLNECGWKSTDTLSGLAYIVIKSEYPKITTQAEQDANPWKGTPSFSTIMRGRYIFDDWDSLNVSSPQAYTNQTGWVVSYNPVSCLTDYLRNKRFGKGLDDDEIDWTTFKDAGRRWIRDNNGNIIDLTRRHNCNAAIFTERTVFDNVTNFLYNMRAALPFQQGKYKLRVEDNGGANGIWDPVSPTAEYEFNLDNILGDVVIESDSSSRRYNRIVINYPGGNEGADQEYDMVDFVYPPVGSALEAAVLAEDNHRVNETKMSFEHICDVTTANYMAQLVFNLNRYKGKTLAFKADSSAHNVEVMDIVQVTYPGLGINGKFRVRQISINSDYTFGLVLSEHEDLTYAIPITRYNPYKAPSVGYVGAAPPPTITTEEQPVVINGTTVTKPVEVASNQSVDVYLPSSPVPNNYAPLVTSASAQAIIVYGNLQGIDIWAPASNNADFPYTYIFYKAAYSDVESQGLVGSSPGGNYEVAASAVVPGQTFYFDLCYGSAGSSLSPPVYGTRTTYSYPVPSSSSISAQGF